MSIAIEQLRHVRLACRVPEQAAAEAQQALGLREAFRQDGEIALRSDARAYTLILGDAAQGRSAIGLEVRDHAALGRAAEALAVRGIAARFDDALATRRQVKALLAFATPGGLDVELVWRPQHKGWRFFPLRDSGVVGLEAVAVRTPNVAQDEALWTELFGLSVRDWVGDAAYLGFDAAHHRLALHPSAQAGVLAVEYAVESVDKLMQQHYLLREQGATASHGPGRRPTSGQAFLSFPGPDGVHFSMIAEGRRIGPDDRPRQFPAEPSSYCAWGSDCAIAEFQPGAALRPRPALREVGKA